METHRIVHLRSMYFIICKFYFNSLKCVILKFHSQSPYNISTIFARLRWFSNRKELSFEFDTVFLLRVNIYVYIHEDQQTSKLVAEAAALKEHSEWQLLLTTSPKSSLIDLSNQFGSRGISVL